MVCSEMGEVGGDKILLFVCGSGLGFLVNAMRSL